MNSLAHAGGAILRVLLVALLLALLLIMGAQIVARYFLNASLIWAEEMCRYLLIWASFLGVVVAYGRGEIAAVEMFRDMLPARAGLVVAILVNCAGAALCGVLVFYGWRYAHLAGSQPIPAVQFLLDDISPGMTAPALRTIYLALPIGMGLLGVRLLVDAVRYGAAIREGTPASVVTPHGPGEGEL